MAAERRLGRKASPDRPVPKAPRKPRIGLALGSGAARGWAHIGVVEALNAAGVELDVVTGCSIGAFVGAALVTGHIGDLGPWARQLEWREILGHLDLRFTGGGLIEGDRLMRFMSERQDDVGIQDLPIAFGAVATDLATGREVWLREGSLFKAVRASVALPGLVSPAAGDGRWLVDGALVNPVPVSLCRALGADQVIAVNLNSDLAGKRAARRRGRAAGKARRGVDTSGSNFLARLTKEIPSGIRGGAERLFVQLLDGERQRPSYFDVVADSISIMQDQITRSRMAGDPPEVLLQPRLGYIRLMDFNRAEDAIAEGRDSVERILPQLKETLQLSA